MILGDFESIWGDSKLIRGDSKLIWSDSAYIEIWLNDRQIGQKIKISKNEEMGWISMKNVVK